MNILIEDAMMTDDAIFFGREEELETLVSYLEKPTASLMVMRGRRRVGKSRLIDEFSKKFKTVCKFSGVAPNTTTTAQTQREEFVRQLQRVLGVSGIKSDDWGDMFWHMANQIGQGRTLVVLDEITWMGDMDPGFLTKLQYVWENHLKQKNRLILIICGSVSAWIEANILNNTAFVGRISCDMQLRELPIDVCLKFWRNQYRNVAIYEVLKVLSVTGGIPWYLEHVNSKLTAEENIKRMAFKDSGVLFTDFDRIFTDVFGKKNELYVSLVKLLVKSSHTQAELLELLGKSKSGDIGVYLNNLIQSGFVWRDYTWQLATGKEAKYSRYRLSDNYVRFYLKHLAPNKDKIKRNSLKEMSLSSLPGWDTIMGLQFENLVLNNRNLIKRVLNIKDDDVVYDNPYFQTQTQRQKSCQFDYVIQLRTNNIYVFEFKFSKDKVKTKVITEMVEKVARLKVPKHFSVRPVLLHVNGVEPGVVERDYFVKIIDFSALVGACR